MDKRITAALFAVLAASIAACGGGSGGYSPPSNSGGGGGGGGGGPTPPPGVGANTVGMAQPNGTIGTVASAFGVVGGFTQQTYSQVLAFAPGTTITLKNLSSNTPHTFNVLSTTAFPAQPAALSTSAAGDPNNVGVGFQSGNILPGQTMQIKLMTAGTYFIGCAYHFNDAQSMRDVVMVSANASPGPQATPQPSGGGGGGGGGCAGPYC